MIDVFFYAFICSVAVLIYGVRQLLVHRRTNNKRELSRIGFAALLPLLPYFVVETQTALWRGVLLPAAQVGMDRDSGPGKTVTFKVLAATPWSVYVYAIAPGDPTATGDSRCGYAGFAFWLDRIDGRWTAPAGEDVTFNTIWSDRGSADDNIFPPYAGSYDYPEDDCAPPVVSIGKKAARPVRSEN